MSRQLSFPFEELPLVIDNGFSAGLVNGSALVNYWTDGTWGISQIYLDGSRLKSKELYEIEVRTRKASYPSRYEARDVLLDRGDRIANIIWDRLEHEWRGQVQEAVNHAIEEERISQMEGV